MATPVSSKLKIKEGFTLLVLNKPDDFENSMDPLPANVSIVPKGKKYDQVHWFVNNRKQMEKQLDNVLSLLKEGIVCWTYYPKGTSKLQTDLTRDRGWEELLKHDELHWISLVSFDGTWSTFGFRLKTGVDIQKESRPRERPIFDYIDAATKTVRLPEDLETAFNKNSTAAVFFNSLSFTNRKEYVEWIVSAKRPETRTERIQKTVEKLEAGWKNPTTSK